MNLPKFSIKRPVTTLMIFLLVVVMGFVSVNRLSIDLLPKMTFPIAAVFTTYEGAGPQEIENIVTKPLEEVLGTVANVQRITTITSSGQSIAVMEFDWGTDMDFALLNVREKIDMVKRFFPDGVESPMVFKFDPSMLPVMNIAVVGISDLVGLKEVAEEEIKPNLERISGVAAVDISGGLEPEIKIEVDPIKLHSYGVTLQNITQILQAENLNLPGGTLRSGNLELLVRTTGQFKEVEQIANLNIPSFRGTMVKLNEVATVSESFKERKGYVLLDGQPAVGLSISKESDANTVNVSRDVVRELNKLKQDLPEGVSYEIVMNQAEFIQMSIDNLKNNAIVGGLLAIAILFLFLRNIASTMIIGISIPISIITTFVLIYFAKLNLNMMTLGGLALGVGMLVDNAIVVLENIYRFRQQGETLTEAAIKGSSEVSMAIIASTLTTIVVFLPIVFMGGMTAELFKELALTVTFSLVASLFVAQTLVPMLCSKFLYIKEEKKISRVKPQREKGKMIRWYSGLLKWALENRIIIIFTVVILFVISIGMFFRMGAEFLPQMDEGALSVQIIMPKGSVLSETEAVVKEVEAIIGEIPETGMVYTTVGGGGSLNLSSSTTNQASIYLQLVNEKKRRRSVDEVVEWVRQRTAGIPGAEIGVTATSMISISSSGKPISFKLKGNDFEMLDQISADLVNLIKEVEGTREVESSLDEGRPELQVLIDRERASTLGLNAYSIASYIRTAVEGATATRFKVNGKEYDVVVSLQEMSKGIPGLSQMLIPTPTGLQVPLGEIAEIKVVEGPNAITREDQERVVTISAAIAGRDLNSVTRDIEEKLTQYSLPFGYSIDVGGEAEEMVSAFRDLFIVFLLAIIFVYMILAAQFESLLQPFIIMLTVPLGFIGVVWALAIAGLNLSVPAIVGLIVLAGIVVNNAIVLIDYTNNLRSEGLSVYDALMQAGPTRFRPIMMTALTTILGLLPMSIGIGEGTELQAPLAVVVIGGLVVSTFLTLIVIPVFYVGFNRLGEKIKKRLARDKEQVIGA
jgi:HAE1 family hydrophobic/amphiphilic exporter-1